MISLNHITFLFFIAFWEVIYITVNGLPCEQTCTTPACVQLAAQILQKLDNDVNSCNDFYKFSCGKYPEDSLMSREGMNEVSSQSAYHPMYEQLVRIIENSASEDPESIEYKRKVIFESCVNSHDSHKETLLMKKRLSEYYIPNWPNVDDSTNGDIDRWLARLLIAEEFAFITTDILLVSPEVYSTYFSNRGMTVPPYISNNSLKVKMDTQSHSLFYVCTDALESSITDFLYGIMDDLGFSEDTGQKIVEDAIRVDRLLDNIVYDHDYNVTSYDADCQNASETNRWCRVFALVVKYAQLNGDFSVARFTFSHPSAFRALDETLSNLSSTAIANHLAIRFLLNNLDILSYVTKSFDFPCISEKTRWTEYMFMNKKQSCASFIVSSLPLLVAQEYIALNNMSENVLMLRRVLKQLLNATVEVIDTSGMPEKMKTEYDESLARTTIEQFDYVSTISSLNDTNYRYKDLKPNPLGFFYNIEATKWIKHVDELQNYEEGYFRQRMPQLNLFNTNARSGEDVSMGFGFYHIPYTVLSLPKFVFYARFGYTLAHEIIHNVHSIIYSKKTFKEYENCVIDLFSKFVIPVINVPAKANLTFGENFADLLGKEITFKAYLNDVYHNQPQQKLPGLEMLSFEQLFFILSAQDWCEFGSDFKQYMKNQHGPSEHRINGPSMNIKAFSNIFNCKSGSPMNFNKRCKL